MKKIFLFILSPMLLFITVCANAQDVEMGLQAYENGVPDANWNTSSTTAQFKMNFNNNGNIDLPAYKVRPLITVDATKLAFKAVQPGLPAGWTVLTNTGNTIRLSNGTDNTLSSFTSRIFYLDVQVLGNGSVLALATWNIHFSDGIAPGSANGPQTVGNDPGNDGGAVSVLLPLRLLSFTAAEKNCSASLDWKASEEVNASHFEVEVSKDGVLFNKVATVPAKGDIGSYNTIVAQSMGAAYYRLKSVDKDGKFTYSSTVPLNISCQANDNMSLYPNPVTNDKNTTLSFTTSYKGKATIRVTNTLGQQVAAIATVVTEGVNNKPIATNKLANGVYYITLVDANGNTIGSTQKLVK